MELADLEPINRIYPITLFADRTPEITLKNTKPRSMAQEKLGIFIAPVPPFKRLSDNC